MFDYLKFWSPLKNGEKIRTERNTDSNKNIKVINNRPRILRPIDKSYVMFNKYKYLLKKIAGLNNPPPPPSQQLTLPF